jgi:hypothetical protein
MRRLTRLAFVALAGVVLGGSLYTALVKLDLLRGPFDPVLAGDIELARSERDGLRVLFVGNSLTAGNSLPELVSGFAAGDEGAEPIFAVQYVAGSWTLRKAAQDEGLSALLRDVEWDVVVLQENTGIAVDVTAWGREMFPAARALDRKIAAAGARTVLFMTWGVKEVFSPMQVRIAQGYLELGAQLRAEAAPVGLAWAEAIRRKPELELWRADGRHPSLAGSYLAAAVLYAILSGRDPTAKSFAGLPREEARFLSEVAIDVVERFAQRAPAVSP